MKITPTKRRMLSWLPAVAGMGAIFYLSSLPGKEIVLPPFPFSDKLVHFLAYFALGGLISLRHRLRTGSRDGAAGERMEPTGGKSDWTGMAIGMLYGVSDEIHQLFVPLRQFELSDMAADGLGVAAACWAYGRFCKTPNARSSGRG